MVDSNIKVWISLWVMGIKDRNNGLEPYFCPQKTLILSHKSIKQMHTRTKGNKGEDIACSFLIRKGFIVLDRNYLKKWGELDIIAKKDEIIHFFEVKSVTVDYSESADTHQPEENVHNLKTRKIARMVQTYLSENGSGLDQEFQFHVLCVYMNPKNRMARVKWLENIIL